jgi:hypothetical protein
MNDAVAASFIVVRTYAVGVLSLRQVRTMLPQTKSASL